MLRFTSEFEKGSGGTTALWTPSKLAEYRWSFVGLWVVPSWYKRPWSPPLNSGKAFRAANDFHHGEGISL